MNESENESERARETSVFLCSCFFKIPFGHPFEHAPEPAARVNRGSHFTCVQRVVSGNVQESFRTTFGFFPKAMQDFLNNFVRSCSQIDKDLCLDKKGC